MYREQANFHLSYTGVELYLSRWGKLSFMVAAFVFICLWLSVTQHNTHTHTVHGPYMGVSWFNSLPYTLSDKLVGKQCCKVVTTLATLGWVGIRDMEQAQQNAISVPLAGNEPHNYLVSKKAPYNVITYWKQW